MKIIFMGTPDFSAGILESIIKAGHEVALVVTQPDRPKGRGGKTLMTPVKETALSYGVPVYQPQKIRNEEGVSRLSSVGADIAVVAAFGQILSQEILDIPPYGCINVHASLLPKYRGASPIQQAILNGDEKTGVTIMQMDAGIDTGDILLTKEVDIAPDETGGSLFEKLSAEGASLIVDALKKIEEGSIRPVKQDEAKASHVKQIKKEMGRIDFSMDAVRIERMIRAFDPWPGALTVLDKKGLKLWEAEAEEDLFEDALPGQIVKVDKEALYVKCGKGSLKITSLQLEGKKRMKTKDFLLGFKVAKGDHLG